MSARFIGNGNAWVDEERRRLRGWRVTCSRCGTHSKIVSSHKARSQLPPIMLTRKFERLGWFIARDEEDDLCPQCYAEPRQQRGWAAEEERRRRAAEARAQPQHGPHIDSLPVERNAPLAQTAAPSHPPEPEPEPEPERELDAAALIELGHIILAHLGDHHLWSDGVQRRAFRELTHRIVEAAEAICTIAQRLDPAGPPATSAPGQGDLNRSMLARLREQIGGDAAGRKPDASTS
jgi:hypothetical protein